MEKTKTKRIFNTALALLALSAEMIDDSIGLSSLSGKKGIYTFSRKLNMGEYQLKSALQSLERNGYIEKIEDKFLITPKGKKRVKFFNRKKLTESENQKPIKWDGNWRVVIFDIPESKRASRDALRRYLRQNNFVKLQNSVFVSTFADFDQLNELRYEYEIEKYVNFLLAKSVSQDDDSLLKQKFNL